MIIPSRACLLNMKCYILGAGASYGYDDTLDESERPPLGANIIDAASNIGLLTEDKYPNFLEFLKWHFSSKGLETPSSYKGIDIESLLDEAANELDEFNEAHKKELGLEDQELYLERIKADPIGFLEEMNSLYTEEEKKSLRRPALLQSCLGESWYLMYEIFNHYSSLYKSSLNNYQKLAESHIKEPYNVISLNYDLIFETAIESVNLYYQYLYEIKEKSSIPRNKYIDTAKVHGSINWLNPMSEILKLGTDKGKGFELLRVISGFPYSNRLQTGDVITLCPKVSIKKNMDSLLRSGDSYDEPILLPPIGRYKDYNKYPMITVMWEKARLMIEEASDLVFIGTSLREEDTKLRETLRNNSYNVQNIKIVGGGERLKAALKRLLSNSENIQFQCFKDFSEYAKTL